RSGRSECAHGSERHGRGPRSRPGCSSRDAAALRMIEQPRRCLASGVVKEAEAFQRCSPQPGVRKRKCRACIRSVIFRETEHGAEKRCSACHRWLALEAFHRNKSTVDGRTSRCRDCTAAHLTRERVMLERWPLTVEEGERSSLLEAGDF